MPTYETEVDPDGDLTPYEYARTVHEEANNRQSSTIMDTINTAGRALKKAFARKQPVHKLARIEDMPPNPSSWQMQRNTGTGAFTPRETSPERQSRHEKAKKILEELWGLHPDVLERNIGNWIAICTETKQSAIADKMGDSPRALDKAMEKQGKTRDPLKTWVTQITKR
ncbi:MAG: hypothetical protein ABII07_03280 [Patescibacteria group bacterium]|nr:hypothetical protein [Patescibacteria group bacterium]